MSTSDAINSAAKVDFLAQPSAYPDKPAEVEVRETHLSWLFLTPARVYKLKKPLRYDFLDFSTLAARRHYCQEEVRLNRRLSPDVYLGVVPLVLSEDGHLRLAGAGRAVDWLVQMRRLENNRVLVHRLQNGPPVTGAEIESITRMLADFYRAAPPAGLSESVYIDSFAAAINTDLAALLRPEFGLPQRRLDSLGKALQDILSSHTQGFAERVRHGCIIEAHGDLRPEHIYLGDSPAIIDCLEFNRALRLLDPVDELGFLALECERLGAAAIGERLFAGCACLKAGAPPALIHFYRSYRALLWAKLAILHLERHPQPEHAKWRKRTDDYLTLAERHSELSRGSR